MQNILFDMGYSFVDVLKHMIVENGANIFFQIGFIIILATVFAFLAKSITFDRING